MTESSIAQWQCSHCHKFHPLTSEYFHPTKDNNRGLSADCRTCRAEVKRRYFQEHKADRIAKQREKRHRDPEARRRNREGAKKWRDKNHERFLAYMRTRNAMFRELSRQAQMKRIVRGRYRYAPLTDIRRLQRVASIHNRRAKRAGIPGHIYARDIEMVYRSQKGRCWWCSTPLGEMLAIRI